MNWYSLSLLLFLEYTSIAKGLKTPFDELMSAFIKLIPMIVTATVAVGLKLMVDSRKKKITFWAAFISWLGAVFISYLFYPAILEYSSDSLKPLWMAFVVLVGDKIVVYFVEKFNVDTFLSAVVNAAANWITKK